jgi:transcriptional regulator with XRE-family HTH domain
MAGFGLLLRHWRETRGLSQQTLAADAGMSARHLSFLETERCGPSEIAVLNLGRVLELSDREVQRLLYTAGFASNWNRTPTEVTPRQLSKVAALLAAQDPYPAFITDPQWRITAQNRGGAALFRRCLALNPTLQSDPFDIAEIVGDPTGLGRILTNAGAIQKGIIAGLFELEPDPAVSGITEHLYERVAGRDAGTAHPPAEAFDRTTMATGAWEIEADFEDAGTSFSLELLAIPFGGPCAGYGLLLTEPIDEAHAERAAAYFTGLMDGL